MSRHRNAAQRGHEHSDVAVGPIVKYALILALGTAASMAAMALLLHGLGGAPAEAAGAVHPLAATRPQFPQPRLQTDPLGDLERHRAWEDQILQSHAWIDRERGLVRLPAERALAIVAQRGLAAAEQQLRGGGQ